MFTGFIGLSAAFELSAILPSWPVMLLLRILFLILPKLRLKPCFDPTLIVSDLGALKEWEQDPLVAREKLTVGYVTTLASAASSLQPLIPAMRVPMLMMWGTGDKVVSLRGHELMVNESHSVDHTLKLYEGAYHNILAEPKHREQAVRDIADWILKF
jgi:acylglycerol lipase